VILMTVAAGRHAVLARIAIVSAVASILLGIVLALLGTPLGPGLGTVVAVGVSNLVAIPILLLPRIGVAWQGHALAMAGGYFLGCVAALPVAAAARLLGGPALVQVVVGVGGMLAVAAAALVLVALRWRSTALTPSSKGWL
jgi:multisubunit Na+/H+ antiporter MnhF subunit